MNQSHEPILTQSHEPISFVDLTPLTPEELDHARDVSARIQALVEWRSRLADGTDLPDGNWSLDNQDNDFVDAYRHVAKTDYDTINHLRLFTNTFTGYKLVYFRPNNHGFRSVMPIPQDDRKLIAANLPRLEQVIELYSELKELLPAHLVIQPCWKMGEVGANVDGVIVNQDTVRNQSMIGALWCLGILDALRQRIATTGTAHVVEIGAGYGALALYLKRIFPQLTYTIVDLPEALLFSGIYLSIAAPESPLTIASPEGPPPVTPGSISLVPNFQFAQAMARLPGVDLAINVSSFGEMADQQVDRYAHGLSSAMLNGGVLFECNESHLPHVKTHAVEVLSRHFAFTSDATVLGFPMYEGVSHLHANHPIESLLTPIELKINFSKRRPEPVAERPSPAPLSRLLRKLLGTTRS